MRSPTSASRRISVGCSPGSSDISTPRKRRDRYRRRAMRTYFTDFFDVDPAVLERYGAFNVSLVTDLPLFVDPFLLFNSKKKQYQALHSEIIRYLVFLRDKAHAGALDDGLVKSWYLFPEVKQNWLGFTTTGNGGSGLGKDFAFA